MKKCKIIIDIQTELDGYNQEKLEDTLGECLKEFGIEGEIYNEGTGNNVIVLHEN